MTKIRKGTHEYDFRSLLTEEDYDFLESIGIETSQDGRRISYQTIKRICLTADCSTLKVSQLVSLDIILNKVKVAN